MKCSPLLPQLALVFAVAYACTDSTAPATSRALLAPNGPELVVGDPPPPPVDAAIMVCTSAGCAAYEGTYFSNGSTSIEAAVAAAEVGDLSLTFDGTAWLKFNNHQPQFFGTSSANARFKRQDDKLSGTARLVINGQVVVVTAVTEFIPFESCGIPGDPCAEIVFKYTVNGGPEQEGGSANAFDRDLCTFFPDGSGGGSFSCGGDE